jgi:nitroreductase
LNDATHGPSREIQAIFNAAGGAGMLHSQLDAAWATGASKSVLTKSRGMIATHRMETAPAATDLRQFVELARSRRSARHFLPEAVPPELLDQLLEATRWAPSGFNLQPTHFVVVTDPAVKADLHPACKNQSQVLEAGATIVFTGDRSVVENQFEQILAQDKQAGAINGAYEALLRKTVPLLFNRGPLGWGALWKRIAEIVLGRFIAIPSVQAAHMNYWLAKQASLSAMTFMLAAHAAGLATCAMEGFGELAVRKALGIPASQLVVLLVAVGYADDTPKIKTRLPLEQHLHRDRW